MNEKKTKKRRARSLEEKNKKYEKILEEGEKLFLKYGPEGTKMRTLAKNLNVSLANLYNYITSKRELWFAIRKKKLLEYIDMRERAIEPYKKSLVELTEKWGEFFLNFAAEDYERYKMIWNVPPPNDDKVGPVEKDFINSKLFDLSIDYIREAFQAENINQEEIFEYFLFLSVIFYGTVYIERFLQYMNRSFKGSPPNISVEKFRKYVLKKLRFIAEANFE